MHIRWISLWNFKTLALKREQAEARPGKHQPCCAVAFCCVVCVVYFASPLQGAGQRCSGGERPLKFTCTAITHTRLSPVSSKRRARERLLLFAKVCSLSRARFDRPRAASLRPAPHERALFWDEPFFVSTTVVYTRLLCTDYSYIYNIWIISTPLRPEWQIRLLFFLVGKWGRSWCIS